MSKRRRRRRRLSPILAYPLWVLMAPYHLLVWLYHQTVGRFLFGVRRRMKKGQSRFSAIFRLLGELVLFPFNLLLSLIWMIVVEWTASRQGRLFLQGLPAVIIGLGTVSAIAFSAVYPKNSLIRSYERYANEAVKNEEFDRARICFEKLAVLEEDHEEHPFRAASMMFEEGDEARAVGIMQTLAPGDPGELPGFAPAHLWMWRHLMQQDSVTQAMRTQALTHLRKAHEASPDDPNIQLVLARMLISEGASNEALPLLEGLSKDRPQLRLQYVQLLRAREKDRGVEDVVTVGLEEIQDAREDFESMVKRNPLDLNAWMQLSQCHIMTRDYDGALEVLERAYRATGKEKLIRQAQARVFVASADYIINSKGGIAKNLDDIVVLLENSLTLAPNDQAALALLVTVVNSPEIDPDDAIKMLQDKLGSTKSPAMVHFLLGSKYATKQDFDNAMFHFERARKLSPQTAAVLNNMAWVLSNMPRKDDETEAQEKERLEQALSLIDQAIEGEPTRVTYYDTRGQIRTRLGMYKEALDDLERAQPAMADQSIKFHEALATCYENLGQETLAQIHREKAVEIQNRATAEADN